jgi:hypothetical protein
VTCIFTMKWLTGRGGVSPPSYRTVTRRLPVFAQASWRQRLAAGCAAHTGLGPASLVLYDVSTLQFETDAGDGFREPGFSKERRLDPQITIGVLIDAAGSPLMVNALEAAGLSFVLGVRIPTSPTSSPRGDARTLARTSRPVRPEGVRHQPRRALSAAL